MFGKQLRSVHVALADSQHSVALQQDGPSTEWQKAAGPVQYLHVVDPSETRVATRDLNDHHRRPPNFS